DESRPVHRHPGCCAIVDDPLVIRVPADQLLAVVGERIAANDAQVASFQLQHELREDARLEVAALDTFGRAAAPRVVSEQPPPAIGYPAEVEQWDLAGLTIIS